MLDTSFEGRINYQNVIYTAIFQQAMIKSFRKSNILGASLDVIICSSVATSQISSP